MESEVNEVKEVEVLENEFDKLIESMPLEDGFYDEDEDDDNLDDEDDDDYEFDYAQVSSSAATKQASDIVIQSEVDVPDLFVQPIQNSDQLFGRGVESVWQHGRAVNRERKIKKLRTGRTAGKVLPKEVSIPLGEAQMHFVNKEYNEAIEKLSIVARLAPRLSDPYHILGLIYEESGDILRALQFYSLAASYSIKPAELSKKIAYLATDVGEYDQAMLYVNKALKFKSDPKLVFLRLRIKVESGRVRSADLTVKQLLERFPLRRKYLLDYGDLCQRNGCGESSVAAFLKYINIVTNSSKNSFNEPAVDISDTSTLGSRKTTAEEVDMADRVSAIWYACRRVVDQWLDKPLQKLLHYSTRSLYLIDQCSKYIRSLAEEGEEVDVTPPPDVLLLHGLSLFRSKVEGDENVALELVKPILSKPAAYLPPTSDISATIAETGDDGFELMSFFLRQYLRLAVKLGLDGRQAAAKKLAEATLNALADLTKQISVPLDIGAIAEKPVSELARWRADAESERRRVVCNQLWRRLGLCFEQRLHDSERALSAYLQALEVARIGNDSESLCRFASLGLTHNESVRSSVKDLVTAHLVILLNQFEADTSTEPTATRANNLIKVQPPVANVEVPTEGGEETLDGEVDADQVDEEVEEPTMTDAPKEDDDGEVGGEEDALASHTNALRLAAKQELRGATGCHLYSKKQLVEELKLLVIWAKFFHEEGDEASFLCIIYPVLLCWAAGPEALGLRPAALTSSTAEDSDRIPRGMVMLTRLQAYCQKHVKESVDYQFVWLDMMQRSFYCLTATLLAFAFGEPVISGKEQALELFESARISLDHLGRNGEAQLLKSTTAQKLTYLGVRGFASSGLSTRTEGIGKISRVRDTDELNKEEKDDDYVGYDEEDDDDEFAIPQKRRMTSESRIQASLNVVGEDDRRLLVALKPTNRLPTETETLFVEAAKTISPAVYNAAIDFVANVFDNTRVNILARCLLSEAEVRGIDSNSFERCFPIRRLYTQYPDSTSLTLLHAHELASRRRYAESFDTHLRAYQLDPTQPQTCLCLGLMLLFFSQHVLVNRKPQVLIKGLAFMDQYRSQRVNVSEHNHNDRVDLANMSLGGDEMTSVSQQAIQQEIYYNFGRFFQEAKLFNLAVDNYNKALEIADTHPRLALTPFSLTREVAFNLILIYKQSGADNMVLNIMSKYLSF